MFNDCEPKRKVNWCILSLVVFAILTVLGFGLLIGMHIAKERQYDDWYNSLSVEERERVDAEKEAEYDANVFEYEVLNLSQYVQNKTNGFGGIVDTKVMYTFSYINEDGQLTHIDAWNPSTVEIGNETKLIHDKNTGRRTLIVDKNTLNNMPTLATG